jgi:hypothetical protein
MMVSTTQVTPLTPIVGSSLILRIFGYDIEFTKHELIRTMLHLYKAGYNPEFIEFLIKASEKAGHSLPEFPAITKSISCAIKDRNRLGEYVEIYYSEGWVTDRGFQLYYLEAINIVMNGKISQLLNQLIFLADLEIVQLMR